MKHCLCFLLFLLLVNLTGFSDEINVVEEFNIYGGKTIEKTTDKIDIEQKLYSKIIEYYNHVNILIKTVITPKISIIKESGIKEQTDYYNGGVVEKYEMLFTDEFKRIHDFNKVIEEVNNNDEVIKKIWYNDETLIDIAEHPENTDKFEFYNIKYIENEFLEYYEPNQDPEKEVYVISYKYVSIRSIIKFDTELVDLDNNDIEILNRLSLRFDVPDFAKYYRKKVRVYYGNNIYWLYVQTMLGQYVKGQNATIRYYPIVRNGELYLMCVGFTDIM